MRQRLCVAIPIVLGPLLLAGCPSPSRIEPRRPRVRTDEAAVAALPPAARDTLATSRIPTYVLPDAYAAITDVLVEEHWTQLVTTDETAEVSVALFTTDVWHDEGVAEIADLPPPADTVRGVPATYSTTEDGAEVTWIASDVPYLLQITCLDVEDTRCTEPAFLFDLAEALVPAHEETER